MGARKFGVINIGLLGRLPSVQMSRYNGDPSIDRRAAEFNAELRLLLSNLTTTLHRFRYSLADFLQRHLCKPFRLWILEHQIRLLPRSLLSRFVHVSM
ncbi:hypothetical protein EJB05_24165, partial [Eragrostis curvula]